MKCAWTELLAVLPARLRGAVEQAGAEDLWEIRIRLDRPTELVGSRGSVWLGDRGSREDIAFSVNTASRYSPWAAQSMRMGYITAPGGHRIGLGGETAVNEGTVAGFREADSLCIRVAKDMTGIARPFGGLTGSVLILGPPGSGKTTLLRDLCRERSRREQVVVVDERGEVFPKGCDRGKALDVLAFCPKPQGIDMALRTLGPTVIAVDEISGESDAQAILRAGWCGVRLIATAHAASAEDLARRPVYRALWEKRLFEHLLICRRDKSRPTERVDL